MKIPAKIRFRSMKATEPHFCFQIWEIRGILKPQTFEPLMLFCLIIRGGKGKYWYLMK